jgi:hypothetical protein
VTGGLPDIVADAGQWQEQEEPKESSSTAFFRVFGVVGGRIFFEGSGHPVPIGTVCPQRVFIGRPPKKIVKVGVL